MFDDNKTTILCGGCGGKGWVDSQFYGPCTCPICRGTGMAYITIIKDQGNNTKIIESTGDSLKWSEFKKLIESKGVKDDDQIWYIGISFNEPISIEKDGAGWRIHS